MGRGGAVYLSYTALVLLSTTSSAAAVSDLWAVSIDEGPAPSPQDGPPWAAHAIRNRALLPYEIIGIVGSYVVTVVILGTLLLTVGRKLRMRAQDMASKPTEMVKPMRTAFDLSPISPASNKSWNWGNKLKSKKSGSIRSGISNHVSPALDSVISFDNNVIEADRQRRNEEMERLYAAVMAQDERKLQSAVVSTTELSLPPPPAPPPQYTQTTPKRPPRLVTDAPGLRHLQVQAPEWSPRSPSTPKSPIRAIYPPDSPMPPMPSSPTSPIRAEYPTVPLTPTYLARATRPGELRTNRDSRTSSFGSSRSVGSGSIAAAGKKIRKSVRSLKISAPLQADSNSDGARTPLSPRFYTDPGIPPEPPTARTIDSQWPGTARTVDSQWPTTPGTAKRERFGDDEDNSDIEDEQMDQVRDLPQAHPNRLSTYNYANQAQAVTNTASTRPDPTGTTPQNKAPAVASVNNPLPFRQMQLQNYRTAQLQQHERGAYPLSPMTWNQGYPASAGPVKTTFLDVRKDKLGAGPRTGLATPYSPYMPFTPLTPVTPHLTSRAERKQRRREDKGAMGMVTEEEMVVDEKDLWSSGY